MVDVVAVSARHRRAAEDHHEGPTSQYFVGDLVFYYVPTMLWNIPVVQVNHIKVNIPKKNVKIWATTICISPYA